jgi:hypothetical protein
VACVVPIATIPGIDGVTSAYTLPAIFFSEAFEFSFILKNASQKQTGCVGM